MKQILFIFCLTALWVSVAGAEPLKMVINEWNCVSSSKFLKNGGSDTYFGTVVGNGDNWVELAVVADHLDIRGWAIQWKNADPDSGSLTFTNDSLWSDLRQGTIIGLHENDADNDGSGGIGVLASDTSYDPLAGDWDLLVRINDSSLITKNGWKVDNNDWEAKILDASSNVVQDYVGEPTSAGVVYKTVGGLGSDEVGGLLNGPNIDVPPVSNMNYVDNTTSTFLSPNFGQEQGFATLRNAVIPEPATVALLLGGLLAACGVQRLRRRIAA